MDTAYGSLVQLFSASWLAITRARLTGVTSPVTISSREGLFLVHYVLMLRAQANAQILPPFVDSACRTDLFLHWPVES